MPKMEKKADRYVSSLFKVLSLDNDLKGRDSFID